MRGGRKRGRACTVRVEAGEGPPLLRRRQGERLIRLPACVCMEQASTTSPRLGGRGIPWGIMSWCAARWVLGSREPTRLATLHLRAPVQTPCTGAQEGAHAQASEGARVQRICKDWLPLHLRCLAGFHWAQGHSLGLGLTYPHWRRCLPSGSERMDGAELRTGHLTATISSCATILRDKKASFAITRYGRAG